MQRSYIAPLERLLRLDFDVVSETTPCDLAELQRRHQPDLIVLHTGCEGRGEPVLDVANTEPDPAVPRIAFVHRDPFSPTRLSVMNRIRRWNVDAIFTESRPSDFMLPFFAEAVYVPFWVDETVFRDYGEGKSVTMCLSGAGWETNDLYPWRYAVRARLDGQVPYFHAASGDVGAKTTFVGEDYARLLNRSLLAAGCGSCCRYPTLKLLEIPAARSCLVTEATAALQEFGFRDGENCVMATPETVVERVRALLADRSRLDAITDAGHALVQTRHLAANRRHFREWFELWRRRRPGQRIVQAHPFEPMELVSADSPVVETRFPAENPLNEALRDAYCTLATGDIKGALAQFMSQTQAPWRSELRLGAALCMNQLGVLNQAYEIESWSISFALKMGFEHPDPVDLAFTGILSLRRKRPADAANALGACASLRHPALNAARWVAGRLVPQLRSLDAVFAGEAPAETANTASIHLLPHTTTAEWVELWLQQLKAPIRDADKPQLAGNNSRSAAQT